MNSKGPKRIMYCTDVGNEIPLQIEWTRPIHFMFVGEMGNPIPHAARREYPQLHGAWPVPVLSLVTLWLNYNLLLIPKPTW